MNADPSPLTGSARGVFAGVAAWILWGLRFQAFCLFRIALFSYSCTPAHKRHPPQVLAAHLVGTVTSLGVFCVVLTPAAGWLEAFGQSKAGWRGLRVLYG